ncbi:AAA ATPase [Desulfamplus magnetovallimortis]|uniref:AAA ATPase n=1 Tax=Desulfamplus magnetovallimortis TaxID=1246637 RepID=L0R439_9BACT|nr:ATP-dependent Clp protease ATP-binding subunit [Desulfamplus magnetovallimortis]CCO06813.1 AAA ATPase [Desulfamplus magnetovallimortis BW-1]SLM32864.1 AAA ATPase [Desulfamplus magnetovallimortis]
MVNVDTRSLLLQLNDFCTSTLQSGAGMCVARTHYEVSVEHFLLKLIEDSRSDFSFICQKFNIELGTLQKKIESALEEFNSGNSGKPVFSPRLLDLFQDGWMVSSIDLGERKIRSGGIVCALLSRPLAYISGNYGDILKKINRDTLIEEFWSITRGSVENLSTKEKSAIAGTDQAAASKGKEGFIERFCNDFTEKARQGGIDPVFGRDVEIRQIIDVLARRRKNNPICVGEPGVGKTAVVEGLALRIIENDVPDVLKNVTLLELDMGLLEAGAGMKGEFENRLKGVINEIKAHESPVILFIDEAHTLIGAGGSAGGGDAANLLKPALARGELRTVAATTWSEYKKYFEKDPALSRRFQPIKLDEPDVADTELILRGLKPGYEKAHNVIITDSAVTAAAEFSDRYITGRFLPDKAIDLLDTGCARVKINLSTKPPVLEDKERMIQALERNRNAMERDRNNNVTIDSDQFNQILDKIEVCKAEAEEIRQHWDREKAAAERVLSLRAKLQAAFCEKETVNDTNEIQHNSHQEGNQHNDHQEGNQHNDQQEDNQHNGQQEDNQHNGQQEDNQSAEQKDQEIDEQNNNRSHDNNVDSDLISSLKLKLHEADLELAEIQGDNALIQLEVNPDVIARVVSDWTGIPLGKMVKDEAEDIINLEKRLSDRVKGQDHALTAIAEVIRASKAGIRNPGQPIGVFLLAGPSGVGKTETGLAIADLLFGSEKNSVIINMSEFQESHTVSRLIGSPPGYVGFGEGGMLTEAVRRKPYSVVLLDEVEKAHPDISNLFYQVFDKGILTDGEGKEINFKNTVIILTSNLATDIIQEMTSGEESALIDVLTSAIRPVLSQYFKPALLARMTVLPFVSLKSDAMELIVRLKLEKVRKTLMENNKITLVCSDSVISQITARCTEVETGARNIDYILNANIFPRISREILTHMSQGEMPSKIFLDVDEDESFTIEFSG